MKLCPIEDLINQQEPGWALVQDWIASATNAVEVLENDSASARKTLYHPQVTTRSPMGSIIYESGGIFAL